MMLVYKLANTETELAISKLISPVKNAVAGNISKNAPVVFLGEHLKAFGVVFDYNLWC